jgi:hypothetical protein
MADKWRGECCFTNVFGGITVRSSMKTGKQKCRAIAASLGICGPCRALFAAMLHSDNAGRAFFRGTIYFLSARRDLSLPRSPALPTPEYFVSG